MHFPQKERSQAVRFSIGALCNPGSPGSKLDLGYYLKDKLTISVAWAADDFLFEISNKFFRERSSQRTIPQKLSLVLQFYKFSGLSN